MILVRHKIIQNFSGRSVPVSQCNPEENEEPEGTPARPVTRQRQHKAAPEGDGNPGPPAQLGHQH